MTRFLYALSAIAVLAGLTGCYHAQVTTGKTPSGQVVEDRFAHSFINGLVPPSTVRVAQECPNGVARVETKLSFLNLLVGGITGGLYTPMTIRVSCAEGGGTAALHQHPETALPSTSSASGPTVRAALAAAAEQALRTGQPAYAHVRK